MWKDALLILVSCTLFVQMGLSNAIQRVLHIHSRVLSCPKCCTFWTCLVWLVATGCRVPDAVAASFLSSYLSLWLALLHDVLAVIYNRLYEQFTKAFGDTEDAGAGDGADDPAEARSDEVPKVQ